MTPRALYNEHEPFAAAWLRVLASEGHIMRGPVDDRDVQRIRPEDFAGCVRAHFFAGIGGWDLALQLAGWPEDKAVWTASLPCQPFSAAGKQRGTDDHRHLWPVFRDLVEECRPAVIFGEQVASKAGRAWLAAVRVDLEKLGYGVGGADLCAAGVGAPHIRQRLVWCALLGRVDGGLGHAQRQGPQRHPGESGAGEREHPGRAGGDGGLAGSQRNRLDRSGNAGPPGRTEPTDRSIPDWSAVEYVYCLDNKIRPIPEAQSGVQPLAYGVPARVGRLRGYGNAIVPSLAAEFVSTVMDYLSK